MHLINGVAVLYVSLTVLTVQDLPAVPLLSILYMKRSDVREGVADELMPLLGADTPNTDTT